MSCDRFVHIAKDKMPSQEEVGKILEDYLGAFMVENKWGGGRWTALLVGNKSWPFKRIITEGNLAAAREEEAKEERWIEVFIAKDNIDVITRRQDEATMCLADGFAKLAVRYWSGRLEDG